MRIDELKLKAKDLGVKTGKMKKTELIKAIQNAEGNFPCFGTAEDFCDQGNCAFRQDCLDGEMKA